MIRRSLVCVMCAFFFWGCSDPSEQAVGPASASETSESMTNRVDIPASVRSNLGMTFALVERRHVASTIRLPGSFELQPLAIHEYRMTLPGHVDLQIDQFDRVEVGDVLFRYRSPSWPELQHEIIVSEQDGEIASAQAGVAQATIDEAIAQLGAMRKRLETLAQANTRDAELEMRVADLEAGLPRLRAELELANVKLAAAERTRRHAIERASSATGLDAADLLQTSNQDGRSVPAYTQIDWITVRASAAGVVQSLSVTNGAFVDSPNVVLTTIDPDRVRFRATALQSDLARIKRETGATIVGIRSSGSESHESQAADITIAPEGDPHRRMITIIATPRQMAEWMRPGTAAFLEVVLESSVGEVLAIPRSAVMRDGLIDVVFRRDPSDPNKAVRVEADLGVGDGRWVEIKSGMAAGDEIVLEGAFQLMLATSGSAQKGGHFHADGTFHAEDH